MSVVHIIMPMAGEGSRFKDAGYTVPKPLIKLNDVELYKHALNSLYDLTPDEFKYTFIIREEFRDTIVPQILNSYPDATILSV